MRWSVLTALMVMGAVSARAQPAATQPPDHRITIAEPAPIAVGERGAVSVTIAAEPGYTISREGPLTITMTAPEGVTVSKARYVRADAADARAENPRFDLRYQLEAAGEHTLRLRLRFWVCADRSCRPVDVRRTAVIRTAPTPAPSP